MHQGCRATKMCWRSATPRTLTWGYLRIAQCIGSSRFHLVGRSSVVVQSHLRLPQPDMSSTLEPYDISSNYTCARRTFFTGISLHPSSRQLVRTYTDDIVVNVSTLFKNTWCDPVVFFSSDKNIVNIRTIFKMVVQLYLYLGRHISGEVFNPSFALSDNCVHCIKQQKAIFS